MQSIISYRFPAARWTGLLILCLVALSTPVFAIDMSPLKGVVWGSGNRNLIVILHGDGGPGRYDSYAKALAKSNSGTTVVTLTRPAFKYTTGASPGNNRSKDHYTPRNNKLLAQSLATMKASVKPKRFIVVGHSGGSGQLGTVIGAYPGIVDVAILAACPCDVPNWRRHRRGQNNWRSSQSPHEFAAKVPASTKVIAITGKIDHNTRPRFAKKYVDAAIAAGVDITFLTPSGVGHRWKSLQPHINAIIRKNMR